MFFIRQAVLSAAFVLPHLLPAPASSAAENGDSLLAGAPERIQQHRQADATITVVRRDGQPVPDANLAIRQTRHAFLFGCNFFQFGKFAEAADEEAYRQQFAELFNFATLGFYWPMYERQQGAPIHEYTEGVARWCREQGITPKGHPLASNFAEPRWLPDDLEQVKQMQLARITDCVSHFQGLIDIWDVVNEATHFERDTQKSRAPKLTALWENTGRVPFVDICFQAARAANPDAKLLINDYRTDVAYAELIEQMAGRNGQPAYDVIGIQSHMHHGVWDNQKIWEVCERYRTFGVPLHFTELTILSGITGWELVEPWESTPEGEERQAADVRRVYTLLFSHPSVTAITWWDFADRHAWQRAPAGLLNKQLQAKPAYHVLHDLIKSEWWTETDVQTNARGQAAFRGFLGAYEVTVTADGQPVAGTPFQVAAGQSNAVQVVID